jgi:O-antigen/teichoic acid export membrane protein
MRSFFSLSLGHVTAKAIGFGAAVLLARYLDPATLGLYASLAVALGFGLAACNWGTDALGIRSVAREPASAAAIATSVARFRLATVSLGCVIGVVAGIMTGAVSLIAPLVTCLVAFAFRRDWVLLAKGDLRAVSLALLAREVVFLALVVALVRPRPELHGALWCLAAAEVAWTLATYAFARHNPPSSTGLPQRTWLRDGWPIAVVSVMTLANNKVDVPLLALIKGPEEAGPYWAAYNVLFAAMTFAALLTRVVLPEMSRNAQVSQQYEARSSFSLALVCGIAGGVLAVLLSLGASPLMSLLYPDRTQGGADALRLLAFALPAHYLSAVLIGRLVAEGRQRAWTVAAVSAGGLNVLLNLLLIPSFGMRGSALATIASECCLLALVIASFRGHEMFRSLVFSSGTLLLSLLGGVVLMGAAATHGPTQAAVAAIAPLMVGAFMILHRQGALRGLSHR